MGTSYIGVDDEARRHTYYTMTRREDEVQDSAAASGQAAPPPAYEEANVANDVAGGDALVPGLAATDEPIPSFDAATSAQPIVEVPSHATRAEAPLTIRATNEAIKGTYLVELGDSKEEPDVELSSTNGRINVELYFRGGLPRPVSIRVKSDNGSIKLRVPDDPAGRNYHIAGRNTNGATSISLPSTFHGHITVKNDNGANMITQDLMDNAVMVPYSGSHKERKYRVTPSSVALQTALSRPAADKSDAESQQRPDEGADVCDAVSRNGAICITYHQPAQPSASGEAGGSGSCVVALCNSVLMLLHADL